MKMISLFFVFALTISVAVHADWSGRESKPVNVTPQDNVTSAWSGMGVSNPKPVPKNITLPDVPFEPIVLPPQLVGPPPPVPTPQVAEKPVTILYFTAPGRCPACRQMDAETITGFNMTGVTLKKYNADLPANVRAMSTYGIKSIPAYVLLRENNTWTKEEGFKNPQDFQNWINNSR